MVLPVLLLAACGSSSSTTPVATLSSIAITPNPAAVTKGLTLQLAVTGTYSDGTHQTLTSSATFSSGTPAAATVTSPGGLVTGVEVGTSVITATAGGITNTLTVTVNPVPTLQSIAITPNPAPVLKGATVQLTVTGTYSDASHQVLTGSATFVSATTAAATVTSPGGLVTGVEVGTSVITATAGGKTNTVTVTVSLPVGNAPITVAPAPTAAAGNVISLFSSTYAGTAGDFSANVDTFLTPSSCNGNAACTLVDYTIPGTSHVVKEYTLGTTRDNFFLAEFVGTAGANEIDISTPGMTHLHMDLWTPDGTHAVIKLIDAGPDKIVKWTGVEDDSAKITMGGIALTQSEWQHIDIDIPSMAVQQATWTGKNVAQILISVDDPPIPLTVYLDNVYFSKTGAGGGGPSGPPPTAVAAAPTKAAASVISLFSSTYTGGHAGGDYSGNVDSYNASCFGPGGSVADYSIAATGHVVKAYSIPAGSFGIVELIGGTGGTASPPNSVICSGGTQVTTGATLIDATTTAGIHLDIWADTPVTSFLVSLVSADSTNTIAGQGAVPGASPGVNADSGSRSLAAGQWISVDLPFSGPWGPPGNAPTALNKLALVKLFFSNAGTYYIDNVYLYK
jgi:hypothetical protein